MQNKDLLIKNTWFILETWVARKIRFDSILAFVSRKTWWWFIIVMSAVVEKVPCVVLIKELYLEIIKLSACLFEETTVNANGPSKSLTPSPQHMLVHEVMWQLGACLANVGLVMDMISVGWLWNLVGEISTSGKGRELPQLQREWELERSLILSVLNAIHAYGYIHCLQWTSIYRSGHPSHKITVSSLGSTASSPALWVSTT